MALSRRRGLALAAVWTLPSFCLLLIAWSVYARYRIDVPERLGEADRAAIITRLRIAVEGGDDARDAWPGSLSRTLANRGPVVISVWPAVHEGQPAARVVGYADTIAAALEAAEGQLEEALAQLPAEERRSSRIKVDIAVGRAPMLEHDSFLAGLARTVFGADILPVLALHPGLEGVGVTVDGDKQFLLLPDELVRAKLLTAERPVKKIPEFKIGVDLAAIDGALAKVAGLSREDMGAAERSYFRFRTDTFVEQPIEHRSRAPLQLTRGLPPRPELNAKNLREASIQGGRYLVAHLAPNGRYIYEQELTTGEATDPDPNKAGDYSIPRHAGTTYFLAELYRRTGEEFLREPIERAFAHLEELVNQGGCSGKTPRGTPFACVVDKGKNVASLGSTALTLVALAEYRRATKDPRYDDLAKRLAEWVLFMQRPDGSFAHLYIISTKKRLEEYQLLYFSGEAALAMTRMYIVTGDKRYRGSAERALDDLIDWYDFFVGGFIFGQEHWLCISAEAAWHANLRHDRYRVFCDGYAGGGGGGGGFPAQTADSPW